MLPNTNLQYCIIALYVLLKLFGLQMEDWAIEGWTLGKLAGREQARGRWWWCWWGGGLGAVVGGRGSEFMLGLSCDVWIWFTLLLWQRNEPQTFLTSECFSSGTIWNASITRWDRPNLANMDVYAEANRKSYNHDCNKWREDYRSKNAALIYSCVKKAWKPQNISSFHG